MLSIQRFIAAPNVWILSLKGAVDSSNVADLQDAFDKVFENKIHRVVVDLARVDFVASSGFGCFLTSKDRANENGGELVFSAARVQVREIFTLMGLEDFLRFFQDVAGAVQYLSKEFQSAGGRAP